jgi:hypothetical protein
MSEFKLEFNYEKKIYYITFTDEQLSFNPKVSVNHLVNPNNEEKWLMKNLIMHQKMLEWLKENHPEFLI